MSRLQKIVGIVLLVVIVATFSFLYGYKTGRGLEFQERYDEGYLDALEWAAETIKQEVHRDWPSDLSY